MFLDSKESRLGSDWRLHEVSQEIEQLECEQAELESAYERWIYLEKELDRLEGRIQVLSDLVA